VLLERESFNEAYILGQKEGAFIGSTASGCNGVDGV